MPVRSPKAWSSWHALVRQAARQPWYATVAAFGGATAQSNAQHRFSIAGTLTDTMMAVPGMQGAALELMPEATYGKILEEEARRAISVR